MSQTFEVKVSKTRLKVLNNMPTPEQSQEYWTQQASRKPQSHIKGDRTIYSLLSRPAARQYKLWGGSSIVIAVTFDRLAWSNTCIWSEGYHQNLNVIERWLWDRKYCTKQCRYLGIVARCLAIISMSFQGLRSTWKIMWCQKKDNSALSCLAQPQDA